jgi:hypothetical protein
MKDTAGGIAGNVIGLVIAGFAIIGLTAFCGGIMVWAIKFFIDGIRRLGWM